MSSRYPSGFIKASSPQPTSGVSLYGSAKGFWSLMAVSRNMSKSSRQWPDSRNSYPAGQSAYTSPGTYSWVCPANITSVSAVAIGGGGGRTGNLGYISAGGGGGPHIHSDRAARHADLDDEGALRNCTPCPVPAAFNPKPQA